jgi:hypothetical protein
MEIKFNDTYKIIPNDDQEFFDLAKRKTDKDGNFKTKKDKDDNDVDDYEVVAYGITLNSCILKVVHKDLSKIEDTVSLQDFIKLYKSKIDEYKKLFDDNNIK